MIKALQDKGFGFIRAGADEYFFHRSDVDGDLQDLAPGDEVSFLVTTSPKGPRAADVRKEKADRD